MYFALNKPKGYVGGWCLLVFCFFCFVSEVVVYVTGTVGVDIKCILTGTFALLGRMKLNLSYVFLRNI